MSIAFQHLCQLCSPNTSIEDIEETSLDWQAIWEMAIRHRVVPVMADRIKLLGVSPPKEIAQRIKIHNQENLIKGMEQAKEIVRLTRLFNENNIKFVVFKGIALIKLMGQELHQRHHGDIDILLADVEDLWFVDELLVRKGYIRYQPSKKLKLNAAQKRHFLEYEKDLTYIEPEKQINLEVHFKLFYVYKLKGLYPSDIFNNREVIKIANQNVPAMSLKDHQLYLLMHGSISYWFRLKWLCDLSIVSNNGDVYSKPDFLPKAYQLGITRITLQGLYILNEVLNIPVPPEVTEKYKTDPKLQFIVEVAKKKQLDTGSIYEQPHSFTPSVKKLTIRLLYGLNLAEGLYFKRRQLNMYLSNYHDWEFLRLPPFLFWLYFPIKPITWTLRKLLRLN